MARRVRIAVVLMGLSGLVAEIVLLRELLIVFSGNELSIGIILSNWLLVEAVGCLYPGRLAKRSGRLVEAFTLITILFFAFLFSSILLTRSLKLVLGVAIGESVGLVPLLYSSLIVLLPVGLLHGALFTVSCGLHSMVATDRASSAGRVYVLETVGTIVGGLVCTFLLIPYLNSFQAAAILAALNLVICVALLLRVAARDAYRTTLSYISAALTLVAAYSVVGDLAQRLHQHSIQLQWKDHEIVHYQNSRYGNLCAIENQGQYIFFQDGTPTIMTPVPDMVSVEEFVHIPLLAHPGPGRVLILGGGAGGVIDEVLKHRSVESIVYAEQDPLLLDLLERFSTPLTESELHDRRVTIQRMDGRFYLNTTVHAYDVIFVGIANPSSLQTNRYFTREFFTLARQRLRTDGLLVFGVPGSLTWVSEELEDLNSSIHHTLAGVFRHIRVLPGDGRNLFLSSDSSYVAAFDVARIVERLSARVASTDDDLPWHIERKLHQGWSDWFRSFIEGHSRETNLDFRPMAMYYSIAHWNATHQPAFGRLFRSFERIRLTPTATVIGVLLAAFLLVRSLRRDKRRVAVPFAITATGFAGMIYGLLVICAFQAVYGYVFAWIGLLVALYMGGAACGAQLAALVMQRTSHSARLFGTLELALILYSLLLPFVLFTETVQSGPQSAFLNRMLFLSISGASGLLTGAQFPVANRIHLGGRDTVGETGGLLYACDLAGGWLGGMSAAVVFLPVLGFAGTCMLVAILKIASLIVFVTESRWTYREV